MSRLELTSRGRTVVLWTPSLVALVILVLAVLVAVERPPGRKDAPAAARASVVGHARRGSVHSLATRPWGGGVLTLTSFDSRKRRHSLAFGFAIDRGRGWRLVASTEHAAGTTDVGVGSLLVTTSPGGKDQPPWTAVYGELGEGRIARVEIQWDDAPPSTVPASGRAYIVVRRGNHKAIAARFLSSDGSEIARVPI